MSGAAPLLPSMPKVLPPFSECFARSFVSALITFVPQFWASVLGMTSRACPAALYGPCTHTHFSPQRARGAPVKDFTHCSSFWMMWQSICSRRQRRPVKYAVVKGGQHLLSALYGSRALEKAAGDGHLNCAPARDQPRVHHHIARHAHGVMQVALHLYSPCPISL